MSERVGKWRAGRRHERAVCARCGLVMEDCEPMGTTAEFHHRTDKGRPGCPNAGKTFLGLDSPEVRPFLRKRARRRRAVKAPKLSRFYRSAKGGL